MDQSEHTDPVTFLKLFFSEMRQWQLLVKKRRAEGDATGLSDEDFVSLCLADLRRVYEKYCVFKNFPTNIVYFDRPSYDPEAIKIVEISENKGRINIVLDRFSIQPHTRLRFAIIREQGTFRISDKVQRFSELKNKFVPYDLLL